MKKKRESPPIKKSSQVSNGQETNLRHFNKIRSKRKPGLYTNPRYFFFFKNGRIHYELKKEFKDE